MNRQLEQASQEILGNNKRDVDEDQSKGGGTRRGAEDDEAAALEAEEETNYYKENIFNKEDYYLYRAVMQFYTGEYEKAINDFE